MSIKSIGSTVWFLVIFCLHGLAIADSEILKFLLVVVLLFIFLQT